VKWMADSEVGFSTLEGGSYFRGLVRGSSDTTPYNISAASRVNRSTLKRRAPVIDTCQLDHQTLIEP
jgi:hypothetical protein